MIDMLYKEKYIKSQEINWIYKNKYFLKFNFKLVNI